MTIGCSVYEIQPETLAHYENLCFVVLRMTWIGNASRKQKFDSTVIVMACNGSVYEFPCMAQFEGFESDGYDLESSFSDGSLIEEDIVIIEDGVEAREQVFIVHRLPVRRCGHRSMQLGLIRQLNTWP